MLALLVLQRNRPIAAELLADRLWPDDQPLGALKTVQVYVSRLRRSLGTHAHRLTSSPTGYRLAVADDELDAARFERGLRQARETLAAGRFIFGLGAGHEWPGQARAFGLPEDRIFARFDEALQIIVPLLRTGRADFEGAFHAARELVQQPIGPRPNAIQPRRDVLPEPLRDPRRLIVANRRADDHRRVLAVVPGPHLLTIGRPAFRARLPWGRAESLTGGSESVRH